MNRSGKEAVSRNARRNTQGQQLAKAVNWIVTSGLFADVKVHGNTNWCVTDLVQVAVLWVWSSKRKMVEAAKEAIEDVRTLFNVENINSYQTLLNGLKRYSDQILAVLCPRMHGLMEQVDDTRFRIGCWLVLAVDGSRVSTCRTLPNEKRFCKPKSSHTKKKRSKKKKRGRTADKRKPVSKKKHYDPQPVGPQVWLTLLWHVGLQMPWAWKIGPSYSSERGHFLELIGIIQQILRRPDSVARSGDSLRSQLSRAITDGYQRHGRKKSRNYPRRKEEPRTSPPKVERATAEQKRLDRQIASLFNAA